MSVRLFVGNLPYDATEDEIRSHFSSVGNLSYVFVPVDRETGKKRGFAFVEFADETQAQEAIRQFNNQPFKGRPLAVNEARARDASAPRPPLRPPAPYSRGPVSRGPAPSFSEPGAMEGPRGDRPARKNFGPDAKPARVRAQKFKPDSGKKSFKERLTGQIFGADDEEEVPNDAEIDNFATGVDEDEAEE
jgi:RNA recognition motif-containing protein